MTYEEARKEAERIARDYVNELGTFVFPYGLYELYAIMEPSLVSDEEDEVEEVIEAFTQHIINYNSPLMKALREE